MCIYIYIYIYRWIIYIYICFFSSVFNFTNITKIVESHTHNRVNEISKCFTQHNIFIKDI